MTRHRIAFTMAAIAAALLPLTASPDGHAGAPFSSDRPTVDVRDRRGDAHPKLDITRVRVVGSQQAVRVFVQFRRLQGSADRPGVQSATGVHFDLRGDNRPEHLTALEGFHFYAGSTSTWNKLRPNRYPDPFGDWTDCIPQDWGFPIVDSRSRTRELVFTAPRACLNDDGRVRVAVQTYRPRPHVKPDWARYPRAYSRWLNLP